MTPSYTFRPQRNAGGYDVILFGTHSVVDVVPTRFKAEQRVRELKTMARNMGQIATQAPKLSFFNDPQAQDKFYVELVNTPYGKKASFYEDKAQELRTTVKTLRNFTTQYKKERGL